jgi:hypothetical protein
MFAGRWVAGIGARIEIEGGIVAGIMDEIVAGMVAGDMDEIVAGMVAGDVDKAIAGMVAGERGDVEVMWHEGFLLRGCGARLSHDENIGVLALPPHDIFLAFSRTETRRYRRKVDTCGAFWGSRLSPMWLLSQIRCREKVIAGPISG